MDDPIHPALRSVSDAANEAGNSGRICCLQQTIPLFLPENIPHIPVTPAGAVRSVRAKGTYAQGQIGQSPKRVVQQTALVAAADQARLLAFVKGREQTVKARAGRAAIRQCERESRRCNSLQVQSENDVQTTCAAQDGVAKDGPTAADQNDLNAGNSSDNGCDDGTV